jgi:hypothetical protein
MSGLVLGFLFGVPGLCGLGLVIHSRLRRRRRTRRIRQRAADRRQERVSVDELRARIERQPREIRWPRVDPDRGVVGDDRPTKTLPLIPGKPIRAASDPATDELPAAKPIPPTSGVPASAPIRARRYVAQPNPRRPLKDD